MSASHVFMFHVLEEPQFSVGPLGKELRLERSVEFLDGHLGSGSAVHCWAESKNKQHEPPSTKHQLMRSTTSSSSSQQSSYPLIRASRSFILSMLHCYNDIIQITVLGHFTHLGRSDTNVWQIGVIINDNDLFKSSKKTEGNQNSNPFSPSDRALILHTFLWKGTHFNWARLKRKLKKINK